MNKPGIVNQVPRNSFQNFPMLVQRRAHCSGTFFSWILEIRAIQRKIIETRRYSAILGRVRRAHRLILPINSAADLAGQGHVHGDVLRSLQALDHLARLARRAHHHIVHRLAGRRAQDPPPCDLFHRNSWKVHGLLEFQFPLAFARLLPTVGLHELICSCHLSDNARLFFAVASFAQYWTWPLFRQGSGQVELPPCLEELPVVVIHLLRSVLHERSTLTKLL